MVFPIREIFQKQETQRVKRRRLSFRMKQDCQSHIRLEVPVARPRSHALQRLTKFGSSVGCWPRMPAGGWDCVLCRMTSLRNGPRSRFTTQMMRRTPRGRARGEYELPPDYLRHDTTFRCSRLRDGGGLDSRPERSIAFGCLDESMKVSGTAARPTQPAYYWPYSGLLIRREFVIPNQHFEWGAQTFVQLAHHLEG